MRDQPSYDPLELTLEYLRRDLLCWVFGNSDNHGRNTAVLRTPNGVVLAPVFDFAPMKMDPAGITRTTRWDRHERGGNVDWTGILDDVSCYAPRAALREGLHLFARTLKDAYTLAGDHGLPDETLHFPAIGLKQTQARLEGWGLL